MSRTLEEIAAEAQSWVGRKGPIITAVIEASAIRRFVEAIGDPNPLYTDPEYARLTRWGGIIAPPTFLCTLMAEISIPDIPFGTAQLNAGNSYRWFRPARPGDVITAQTENVAIYGKVGRRGEMLITDRETRYTNQRGELVALGRSSGVGV
ncbi:MaoC family dehydratase N-terminal domain-containing protein [Streptosporangium sp. NPDC051022]|uniref:MaoC family dehydratase N-terminal domain-containing protein n=1 Tax=Streptosporangium sp. NPDC051022 TaxID=3155752 RepID=UPI00342A141B